MRFLDEVPGNVYMKAPGGNPKAAGGSSEERTAPLVELARGDPGLAHGIMAEYVRLQKGRVEAGDLGPTRCRTS